MKAMLYFLPLLARNRGALLLTLALSLLTLAAGVALLGLSGWFITATALTTAGALFNIIGPSAGVRGLSLLRIVGRYAERYSGHATTLRLVSRTRVWLFERLFGRVPLPRELSRADVVTRLVADLDMLDNVFLVALGPISTAGLTALAMGLGLAILLPAAAVPFVVLFLVATILVPVWLLRRSRQDAQAAVAAAARLRNELLDGLDGHRDLVLFGQLPRLVDATGAAAAELGAARVALGRHAAAAGLAVQLLTGGALVTVLLAGLAGFASDRIDGALLVGVLLAVLASFESSQALVRSVTRLAASIAAAERVMLLAEGEREQPVVAAVLPPRSGRIGLSGVTFAYPGQHPVLRSIDLDIGPGERVAITGPSGSGKSTVAALLVRLIAPQEGTCQLDGVDLARMDPAELRRRVTVMLQDAPVFSDTIRDNLRMGNPAASDAALWDALAGVDLADEVRAAGGLDVLVGEAGLTLSTGQARRLALARTLLCPADVVVLDEPTAGLDIEAQAKILAALGRLTAGRTTIVITHAADLSGFDRVLSLKDGTWA